MLPGEKSLERMTEYRSTAVRQMKKATTLPSSAYVVTHPSSSFPPSLEIPARGRRVALIAFLDGVGDDQVVVTGIPGMELSPSGEKPEGKHLRVPLSGGIVDQVLFEYNDNIPSNLRSPMHYQVVLKFTGGRVPLSSFERQVCGWERGSQRRLAVQMDDYMESEGGLENLANFATHQASKKKAMR